MKAINIILIPFILQTCINITTLTADQKLVFRICHGCCLKHKQNARVFVYKDLPQFDSRVVLEYMSNHKPTFIVRDLNGNEVETLDVSTYSRVQLRETVKRYGIKIVGKLKPIPNETEYNDGEDNVSCDDVRLDSEL